jgi:2-polyprenyl-3-methyl-5-hydroxy-6-metoxy-1,4-benzoquinol methylase
LTLIVGLLPAVTRFVFDVVLQQGPFLKYGVRRMLKVDVREGYCDLVHGRMEEIQDQFFIHYRLKSTTQRKYIDQLLDRVGKVDWQSEGYFSPENQRDLSIKFHWGHNHKFAEDLFIQGRMGDRHISVICEFLVGFDLNEDYFNGKTVLDVGCWTGGTTLTLKQLGACQIVALEEVQKYAETANELFNVYGLKCTECLSKSLYDFTSGVFDCIYVPGVVYHLSDPVLGLRRLFNRLQDGGEIFVESAGIEHKGNYCEFHGNRKYHKGSEVGEFNRGGWNWFIPSASCLALWLEEAGFEQVRVFFSPFSRRLFAHGVRVQFKEITRAGLSVPDIK